MLIILNPNAAGGTAMEKWNKTNRLFRQSIPPFIVHTMNGKAGTEKFVLSAIRNGETDFIAGGGDGTINTLLNILLTHTNNENVRNIRLGAIGLGSSNDFHKPFQREKIMNGIPCKIDLDKSQPRDVGVITYKENNREFKKYFLINASVGATATANQFFNQPDNFLQAMKQFSTTWAIYYSAIKTITSHKNLYVTISSLETGTIKTHLSNLGVVKNQHFSGSLRFNHSAEYDNGRFNVHLFHDMTRIEMMKLIHMLSKGKSNFPGKSSKWSTTSVEVTAEKHFAVEFDGEIIRTSSVHFSILPKCIKVCS